MSQTTAKSLKDARTTEELVGLRILISYWKEIEKLLEQGYTPDGPRPTLEQVLAGDSGILTQELEELIKTINKQVLDGLEIGLCEETEHPELFKKLRGTVLRVTNDAIRELPKKLGNYHVLKYQDTKTVVITPQGAVKTA